MSTNLEKTREHVEKCPVIMKNGYPYLILSIADGINRTSPSILNEIIDRMVEIGDFNVDVIVTAESMGLPFAVPLSLKTDIPFNVIRKRSYGLPDELSIEKHTGYASSTIYFNGLKKGDRVLFVDDMVSTGGTLRSIMNGFRDIGCEVVQVLVAIDKGSNIKQLSQELNVPIRAAFGVDIIDGRPVFRYTE